MADVADLYSNPLELPFTPDEMRVLAVKGVREEGLSQPVAHQPHELSKRLGPEKVAELVDRARAGESVRSLARELDVANSALTRMLRDQGIAIAKRKVSDTEATRLKVEYEAGRTIAELERQFKLSHGAVIRALHRAGVQMRAKAPRRRS